MRYRVLIVEDDPMICEMTADHFRAKSEGKMEMFSVNSGSRVIEILKDEKFDLILLDVMLPDIDGFSVCRAVRRESTVPVIFITARSQEEDVLFGYDAGCDDYVTKPFSLAELYAKSRALLKRANGNVIDNKIVCGNIVINTSSHQVTVSENAVELPIKEYEILVCLVRNRNNVIDRDTLLDIVWGRDHFGRDRVVDDHIRKLRKALGTAGKQIKTVIGKGYRITE